MGQPTPEVNKTALIASIYIYFFIGEFVWQLYNNTRQKQIVNTNKMGKQTITLNNYNVVYNLSSLGGVCVCVCVCVYTPPPFGVIRDRGIVI